MNEPEPLDLDAIEARAKTAGATFGRLPDTLMEHGIETVNVWIAESLRAFRQSTDDIPALIDRIREIEAERDALKAELEETKLSLRIAELPPPLGFR